MQKHQNPTWSTCDKIFSVALLHGHIGLSQNQNDHVLDQTRNSECGMAHNTLVELVFVRPVNIPILSLLPAAMHDAWSWCMIYHLSWSNIYENSQHTEV